MSALPVPLQHNVPPQVECHLSGAKNGVPAAIYSNSALVRELCVTFNAVIRYVVGEQEASASRSDVGGDNSPHITKPVYTQSELPFKDL